MMSDDKKLCAVATAFFAIMLGIGAANSTTPSSIGLAAWLSGACFAVSAAIVIGAKK